MYVRFDTPQGELLLSDESGGWSVASEKEAAILPRAPGAALSLKFRIFLGAESGPFFEG